MLGRFEAGVVLNNLKSCLLRLSIRSISGKSNMDGYVNCWMGTPPTVACSVQCAISRSTNDKQWTVKRMRSQSYTCLSVCNTCRRGRRMHAFICSECYRIKNFTCDFYEDIISSHAPTFTYLSVYLGSYANVGPSHLKGQGWIACPARNSSSLSSLLRINPPHQEINQHL